MDSDRVGLGVTDRVLEGLTDSEPDRLCVTEREEEELGLTDLEGVWDCVLEELADPVCVLEGLGGTRTYERA